MYNYFKSIDDEDTLLLIEKWENEELLQKHIAAPHMARIQEIKKIYVDDVTMVRCSAE